MGAWAKKQLFCKFSLADCCTNLSNSGAWEKTKSIPIKFALNYLQGRNLSFIFFNQVVND